MIRNFLYRVGEYARENRARMIKSLLVAVAVTLAVILIYGFVESVERARYEKRVKALDDQYRDAEARAKSAEARAAAAAIEIEAKARELGEIEGRANAAEIALKRTRRELAPLKGNYETARDTPVDVTHDLSCADLCARLAELGHPCR